LLAFFLATGCVSSKEHKAKLAAIDSLQQTNVETEGRLSAAEKENVGLKAEMSKLLADFQTLSAERDRIKTEKDRLSETLGLKEAQLTESASALSRTVTEVAVLKQEKEKLKQKKAMEVSELKQSYDRLVTGMKQQIQEGQIEITQLKGKLSLRMVNKILFDSGEATVKAEGKKILDEVANALNNITGSSILIAGHTDNVAISPRLVDKFPTNWELSTMRATNVVRYLESTGKIEPTLLGVAGFSKYRPVASNDEPEGRAKNRRIEITLLPIELVEQEGEASPPEEVP